MKLYSAVVLPLLLATLACTPTGVHAAQDGGPQTGGTVSTNPNDRPQNGGPMSGSSTSTNPNGRPSAAADADGSTTGPPSIAPVTTAPITSTPVTSAPVPPPMSGGDLSTNPNRPSATSSASSSPMTMSPSATTEPPRLTSSAPSPQSLPTSDDASAGDDNAASWTLEPSHANAGDAIDFTLINDDGSGVTDIVGEVDAEDIEHIDLSSSRHDELPNNGTTADGSGAVNEDGTANEADAYESNAAGASTPSPVSKSKISSAGLTSASSEPSSSFAAMATLFTMTVWVMFASA